MKELTEKQAAFLDHLFGEAEGNYRKAMNMAGYGPTVPQMEVVRPLLPHINARVREFIAQSGVDAVAGLYHVLKNPTDLGNRERLAAAKEFLDRAGYKEPQKIEVETKGSVFILPEKEISEDEGD